MILETLMTFVSAWSQIFPHDLGRYFIFAGLTYFTVNLGLRQTLADRKIREPVPGAAQVRREILSSIRTAAIFAASGALLVMLDDAGVLKAYENPLAFGWGYLALSMIALIVLHDAWFYWTHRLIHHPRLFRRLHRLHHRSKFPTPWTAYAFDVGEAALNAAFLPLVLLVLPASFLAIFLFLTHMIIRNALAHCGHEVYPSSRNGRPLFDWLTTVTHHDLHHEAGGWNFGLYFTWWDRLMGSEHPLYHERYSRAVGRPLNGSAVRAIGRRPLGSIALIGAIAFGAVLPEGARSQYNALSRDVAVAAVSGIWASEGHGVHVRVGPCHLGEGDLCGDLLWAWDEDAVALGPDDRMLWGFEWTGAEFANGRLRHPESRDVFRGDIVLRPDGALLLKGCAFVFCDSQVWRRLEDVPGCVVARDGTAPDVVGRASYGHASDY
ncbi:MAG: DUF2147 domain-containing protein [Alphaproteobacteria bacterium]|nr:DUF2147 domain-containing protein [Alphaproteobacteria bacterium]